MATRLRNRFEQVSPQLLGEWLKSGTIKPAQVGRGIDAFEQWICSHGHRQSRFGTRTTFFFRSDAR